jgi:hypothetical protein
VGDGILVAIAAARSRLNRAIVAHRALAWAAPSAAAAAIAAAVLRLAGLEAAGFVLWACIAAAGTAVGAARGLGARMGTAAAARWLDERLGGEELLSAALVCVGRGRSGRFDDEVLAAAEGRAALAAGVKVPWRPTARKAALAAAAAAASVLALVLARPLDVSFAASSEALRRAAVSRGSTARAWASEAEIRAAASALAASLFPDDKRMATLAQRALREGRLDDFRDILRGADIDLSSRIDRTVSELEKKKLTRERDLLRDAMSSIASNAGASADRKDRDEGSSGAQDGAEGDGEGAGSAGGSGPGPGDREGGGTAGEGQGEGGGEGGASGAGGPGGEGAGAGGAGWGEGSGSQARRAPVEAASGGGAVSLDLADDSSFFELVLPGELAAAPLSSALPDSRRSAESAMAREGMPLEYRDFVRSYFMALSKGASE